jgi:hypothetical protein
LVRFFVRVEDFFELFKLLEDWVRFALLFIGFLEDIKDS